MEKDWYAKFQLSLLIKAFV